MASFPVSEINSSFIDGYVSKLFVLLCTVIASSIGKNCNYLNAGSRKAKCSF